MYKEEISLLSMYPKDYLHDHWQQCCDTYTKAPYFISSIAAARIANVGVMFLR